MTVGSSDASTAAHAFCAWCGTHLVSGARFCPGCGHVIDEMPSVPDTPPADWVADEIPSSGEPIGEPTADTIPLWEAAAEDQPEAGAPSTRHDRARRRRGVVSVVVGLVIAIVAAVGGLVGYSYLQDRPVREAFETAQVSFASLVEGLSEASDLEQVTFAGQRGEEVSSVLQRARDAAADADTELSARVVTVTGAQLAFAAAATQLGEVAESDPSAWGEIRAAMVTAQDDLVSARNSLAAASEGDAGKVSKTDAAVVNLDDVVGGSVAEATESSLAALLAELAAAKRTADVRTIAETAVREADARRAALEGMPEDSEWADQLGAFVGVYGAVERLSILDGETLRQWSGLRQQLTAAVAAVETDSLVVSRGRAAVESLDGLVSKARTRISDWRAEYDTAVAQKGAETTALNEYGSAMEAQLRAYSSLRSDLSDWIERVERPGSYVTYDEAYSVLSQAQWDRQLVRDAMNGLSVPETVQSSHAALVGVVEDAIAAMQAAYDGATDSDFCVTSCYYADTPGWQRFSSESGRITEDYGVAVENWRTAIKSAEAGVAARTLPRMPRV